MSGASPRAIRWRSVDVAAAIGLIGLGIVASAWTPWVGDRGVAAGLLVLALAPAAGWLYYRQAHAKESLRVARWKASAESHEREQMKIHLRERWRQLQERLAKAGQRTETTIDGERRTSLDTDRLLDPEVWSASSKKTYVSYEASGPRVRAL